MHWTGCCIIIQMLRHPGQSHISLMKTLRKVWNFTENRCHIHVQTKLPLKRWGGPLIFSLNMRVLMWGSRLFLHAGTWTRNICNNTQDISRGKRMGCVELHFHPVCRVNMHGWVFMDEKILPHLLDYYRCMPAWMQDGAPSLTSYVLLNAKHGR